MVRILMLLIVLIPFWAELAVAQTTFTDVTVEAGLVDSVTAVGAAWGDFNNDGNLDLFVTHHLDLLPSKFSVLYRNNGNGTFTRLFRTGDATHNDDHSAAWGDYDNDGDLDLFISRGNQQPDSLLRNDGQGVFTDVAVAAGVADPGGRGRSVAWADIDNDGRLDLFVANALTPVRLYHNNGNGTFTDIAAQAGIIGAQNDWRGVSWADYNGDGYMDLFVTTAPYPTEPGAPPVTLLYRNNGNLTFTEVAQAAGVRYNGATQGLAWGDFDNDGDLDLYVVKAPGPNLLYRNNGNGTFTEIGAQAGVADTRSGDQAIWGDYDNDGDLDLYVVTSTGANLLYRNNGNGTFTDVAQAAGVPGKGQMFENGAAWGDYNNDGFLDLFLTDDRRRGGVRPHLLYRNNGNTNRWLKIRTVGTVSNRDGIGAKITLVAGGKTQFREQNGGSHLFSQNSMVLHFGLGQATAVQSLTIRWPSGKIQQLTNLAVNQMLTVTEPAN